MPAQPAIRIAGASEFRAELRRVDAQWGKAQVAANRKVGVYVRDIARLKASVYGGERAKAAKGIKSYASGVNVAVGVASSKSVPFAAAAIWGTKAHTGWYGGWRHGSINKRKAAGYADGPAQHPPWVGNAWTAGAKGQGPYGINAAIADNKQRIGEMYMDGFVELARLAFPT